MHTMLGPVIAIFFMLCIERVESTPLGEFAETCASSDAQKQANCPSGKYSNCVLDMNVCCHVCKRSSNLEITE